MRKKHYQKIVFSTQTFPESVKISLKKIWGKILLKGPYLETLTGDSWGFCFGETRRSKEHLCKVSAFNEFIPEDTLF